MPIFLWFVVYELSGWTLIKPSYPHGHKHLEIAKSSQPKLPLWRTLGSKMMTCRWKCHGQQSINPKTSKDMLLLDVRMPLKDGWWLIYVRLKSWDSCQHWEDDAEEEEACSSALRLFICHVLVTVGRLSAIIYETLSGKFSSSSLPLRTSGLPFICSSYLVSQKQSSLSFFFSTLRLFSAVAMRGPHSFNTSLSFEQSNHHQTSILYTWLYIYICI